MTAPNPWAGFASPSTNGQYRMGPLFVPSAVDYWWNTQWVDGTYTACGEPDGWESLEYLLPLDQVGGRDGALTGPQSVAPRVLECSALIVAGDDATMRRHLDYIRRIFGPQTRGAVRQPVVWEQYDPGTGKRLAVVCRPSGLLRTRPVAAGSENGTACVVSFTLIAASVWKLNAGAVESNQVGLVNPANVTGRTYSKTYNYTYGAGTGIPGGQMVCTTSGGLDADATFYITGPADNPIIDNLTTGAEFQILYTVAAGETIAVYPDGTVSPSTVRVAGRPFTLAAGDNTISWRTASGAYDPAALLRLEWRSTSR